MSIVILDIIEEMNELAGSVNTDEKEYHDPLDVEQARYEGSRIWCTNCQMYVNVGDKCCCGYIDRTRED